uniref:Uncharacterized protein n=1 Tax=Timema douglasi TaxID=61478 RepID=A0A7R8VRA8_TIMDO|nr:unnamed protein product [Timema douglasi]
MFGVGPYTPGMSSGFRPPAQNKLRSIRDGVSRWPSSKQKSRREVVIGYVPAFVRLGPHTILTFVFLEQLRKNFGFLAPE